MPRHIYSLLGIALLLTAMGWHDPYSILMFINIPSFLLVIGCTLFFTCAHHSAHGTFNALYLALSSRSLTHEESLRHQHIHSTARLIASSSGVVGTMIGLVQMLANMDDPSSIGPAMAVALLCTLYGIILAELGLAPLIHRLRCQTATKGGGPSDKEGPLKVSLVTIIGPPLALFCFCVLLNSVALVHQ